MIKTSDAGVKAGIKALREMSLGKQIRMEIEAREKARRDRVAELEYAWDEGMEKGMEQEMGQGQNLINELNARLPIWAGVFAVMHFQAYNIAASREVCYNILNLKFF